MLDWQMVSCMIFWGTLFECIKLGSTLFLVHFKKESESDNINDVYLINREEIV